MSEDDDDASLLSPEEVKRVRKRLADDEFRDRMRAFVMRWSGRISAAIITGFALYKAVADLIFKKGGS